MMSFTSSCFHTILFNISADVWIAHACCCKSFMLFFLAWFEIVEIAISYSVLVLL